MNILRVNMTSGEWKVQEMYSNFWGRGLIAEILNQEVPPHCHPLGPRNKLIFAVGPLASTSLSSASRMSAGGKSPLTYGAKESNSGGTAAGVLSRWGFKALIVEGLPVSADPHILRVGKDIAVEKRSDLKDTGTYELCRRLRAEFGSRVSIICIGPAGEHRLTGAGIALTDMEGRPGRYAGRGGLGALMGSKGLKAIVIEPRKGSSVPIHNEEEMKKVRKRWNDAVLASPSARMMCSFLRGTMMPQLNLVTEAWNAMHGTALQAEDFLRIGRETVLKELEFNAATGISQQANYLPEFLELEGLGKSNLTFDVDRKSLVTIFAPV